jgi:glycosyltransferase involved in cell wall biosynthesis
MRILYISSFYPPYVIGGWEQLVNDINSALKKRGHIGQVLTSFYGLSRSLHEDGVDRLLTLESDVNHYHPFSLLHYRRDVQRNIQITQDEIQQFKPDVVFIHVMWNLNWGVAWAAEQACPQRVVYYVANDWPYAEDVHSSYWHSHARRKIPDEIKKNLAVIVLRNIKRINRNYRPSFPHVLCVSHAIEKSLEKKTSILPENMRVLHNGVETDQFVPPPDWLENLYKTTHLNILYAGSLVPHKGVHTAIEAMALLNRSPLANHVNLSILGSGHPDYEEKLRKIIEHNALGEKVHFLGRVPRNEMPDLMRKFDVLVFPSIWEEPLARTTQEAMASGLIVIGTLTGGTGELLVEGETGLTFMPEDANGLAEQITNLFNDPELRIRLAQLGRAKVLREFDFNSMIDDLEQYLLAVAEIQKESQSVSNLSSAVK